MVSSCLNHVFKAGKAGQMFLDEMKARVHGKNHRILFAEGDEELVLKAACRLKDENLVLPVVMGNPDRLQEMAVKCGLKLDLVDIHDPGKDENFETYAEEFFLLRKHKGISRADAKAAMKKPHYFGAMMVKMGAAEGLVSGLNSATKPFVPAFQIIGLKPGYKRASSVFVLETPEKLLFFADCAIIKNPDADEMAEIAYATVETVKWLGVEPRVAFLSFSTHDSASGDMVEKVKQATNSARRRMPDTVIDGEVQFDAALLPEVARIKNENSPFVRQGANIFIFPDLNSGNIAYKITERLGKAKATGPMLQGLAKPVNDVSRGCSIDDLVNAAVLTAALAHQIK